MKTKAVSATVREPAYRQSVRDILKSFDLEDRYPEFLNKTAAVMAEYCGDGEEDPEDIAPPIHVKDDLCAADYMVMADEYRGHGEERIAVMLYLAVIGCEGADVKVGEALAKLAELYLNSDLPKKLDRERDVKKAVVLLEEATNRGCAGAVSYLNDIRSGRVK